MEDYIGSTNRTANKFNKFPIFLSATSHLVTDLYASFVIGLIPVLTGKFGLSLFMVSILTSVNQTTNSLTQPLFGYLADKKGLKYYLVSGPLFASLFLSLLGILPNYYLVLLFLFLGNLSISAFHPPSAAVAGHFGGDKRTIGNSIISFGGNLGYSLGSLFVIFIVEKLGLTFTPVTMVPGILMTLVLLKFMPSQNKAKNNTEKSKDGSYTPLKPWKIDRIKVTLLSLIWFVSFSRDLLWITLLTFMPLYFTKANIKLTNIGYILLLFGLVGSIGGLFSGYYSSKVKKVAYIIQIGLFLSIPLIYFIFKTSGINSIVLFILAGFFLISTLPLCINLSQEILPSNISFASSLVMGLSSGSAAIAIIFSGRIADYIGIIRTTNYTLLFPIIALILLFIFPFLEKKIEAGHSSL